MLLYLDRRTRTIIVEAEGCLQARANQRLRGQHGDWSTIVGHSRFDSFLEESAWNY